MANKKISELPYLGSTGYTSSDIMPIVTYFSSVTGDTVHTLIEDFKTFSSSATTINYSNFLTLINNSGLTTSMYYLIEDYVTVYDQPDYFIDNTPKNVVTSQSGNTEPVIVFALSNSTISQTAFQPNYFNDKIKYDYTFTNTEVNGTPCFGRIIERIDEFNNRTDYDHRNIEFKRYETYEKDTLLSGTIQDFDCTTGILSGVSTLFLTEVTVGDILIIDSLYTLGYDVGVRVSAITDDTTIVVNVDPNFTSTIFTTQSFNIYSSIATGFYRSYKELYIGQDYFDSNFLTYKTFQTDIEILNYGYATSVNNFIGDYALFYISNGYTFYLSNNFFGKDCFSNNIGDNSYNNTFVNNFYNNKIGGFCYENIIGGNTSSNTIKERFGGNVLGGKMSNNNIENDFQFNNIGSIFTNNLIGSNFYYNTLSDNFINNDIGNNFIGNIVGYDFESNKIGDFFGNSGYYVPGTVQNFIGDNFKYNVIGNFFGNDTNYPSLGSGSNSDGGNIISKSFMYNNIGDNFIYNATNGVFEYNSIGYECWFNYFGADTNHNVIGNLFVGNNGSAGFPSPMGINMSSNKFGNFTAFNAIDGTLSNNVFGDYFGNAGLTTYNLITSNLTNNIFGNNFGDDGTHISGGNTISGLTYDNHISNAFYGNIINVEFYSNVISNYFISNTINDDGLGSGSFSYCVIDDTFNLNTTAGVFTFNNICSGVAGNDFSLATHVYGSYTTNIYVRPDGSYRLQYYDNSDILQITTINS